MATVYKIHPAIGIARLGNSPDEFFIGPEREFEVPTPAGGFKDAECRVKKQAARFRIYAHHDDGTVEEITDAEAEISWTVHLANTKAAHPNRGNSEPAPDLTIDPGPRTLSGPNQTAAFDTGSITFSGTNAVAVPLGQVRTDDEGRLLVLAANGASASPGGSGMSSFWGNPDWYDDTADGPVSATIVLRATNETKTVEGAWVLCTPPKFAPHQQNIISLYDRVLQAMVDAGLAAAPTTTTYTRDVFPILQATIDTKWVEDIGSWPHAWTHPVVAPTQTAAIYSRLKQQGSNMPMLNGSDGQLTAIQYAHMTRWKDDSNFTNDWTGVPAAGPLTPDGIDRAALDACVGGAFYPGIEAGGLNSADRPIIAATNYSSAFRIDHGTVSPGTITQSMALPWQADFYACGDNWWPVPRPNEVVPQGGSSSQDWTGTTVSSYQDMVDHWSTLGFVVDQGAKKVEVERCDAPSIYLLTPRLDFVDIPQGPMGMVREAALAITFEVISPSSPITLEFAPGGAPNHTQLYAPATSVTTGPTAPNAVDMARLWVVYRTGTAPSAIPTQTVTVQLPDGSQTWTVEVDGNTVGRTTTATALVLDRSGSMAQDRGDGMSKHDSLQEAAKIFVEMMLEGDGVGLVRYDHDAQPLHPVHPLGDGTPSDTNRNTTVTTIDGPGLDPQGATSIGDGIYEGRQLLDAASGYDQQALVILTDGNENRSRWIADVSDEIDARTFAVGLGTPQNTSSSALHTLSGNNGGYLLVTGAIDTENRFVLEKHFLQILAGINNADVVLDPDGALVPDRVVEVPFQLTRADSGVEIVLLTPYPHAVDFRLQTPTGQLIEPWEAMASPSMHWKRSSTSAFYRLALPVKGTQNRFSHGGTWRALLKIGKPRESRSTKSPDGLDHSIVHRMHAPRHTIARAGRPRELERAFEVARAATHLKVRSDVTHTIDREKPRLPYSLVVNAYSNLSFRGSLEQSGFEPGARISLRGVLTESGIPVGKKQARVWAEIRTPDGTTQTATLQPAREGTWDGAFRTDHPGVYAVRLRVRGTTRKGTAFTREQALTAGVWRGGDTADTNLLRDLGLDPGQLRKCLARLCEHRD